MADSVHMKCLNAVKTAIEALSLTGIVDANIVIVETFKNERKLGPLNYKAFFANPPGIFLAPMGVEEIGNQGNVRDWIWYPILLVIYDHSEQGSTVETTNLDKRLLWRETLRGRFLNQSLSIEGGTDVACKVEFGQVLSTSAIIHNRWISGFTIKCGQQMSRAS